MLREACCRGAALRSRLRSRECIAVTDCPFLAELASIRPKAGGTITERDMSRLITRL